jgi:hypothetical protein
MQLMRIFQNIMCVSLRVCVCVCVCVCVRARACGYVSVCVGVLVLTVLYRAQTLTRKPRSTGFS